MKKQTNKKTGNDFESDFCGILFSNGFWCHNMAQNQSGQPADVIAVRNRHAYLIDCKVCSGNGFPISRIEENQDLSMTLWKDRGNGVGWFALKTSDGNIYMMSHYALKGYSLNKSIISNADIELLGLPLERWIEECK